jgi:hypothetical protein
MADSVLYFRVWDRLQLAFRRFINVFARPEHPLAVSSTICNGSTRRRSTRLLR